MLSIQRNKFSLPKGVRYLNCAYMSPLLKSVEKAGIRGIRQKRNPAAVTQQDFFTNTEALRLEFAQFIHAPNPQHIVIIPSVSYGMANVVQNLNLSSGDEIIVAGEQFPSNYYPWQKVCNEHHAVLKVITAPDTLQNRGKQWNERILESISSKTKVVALGNVHWADGTRFDLIQIRKRTRDVGALLVIDGTQSVGALPFDVQRIQPDALVCGGYKWLLGPYSIGLAYYGEYFLQGKPIEENWINRLNSENFAGLVNYQTDYQPGMLRYEVGEHSNFILVPMLLAAIRQLNKWKPENIQEYCGHISAKAVADLQASGFWVEEEAYRGHHLFGVRLPHGTDLEKVKLQLQKNKISVSVRGNAIRIAPHLYNSEAELLKLASVLKSSR